jgi:hypothetical protein
MSKRLILLIVVICMACQSGIIPCPKVKPVRARKTSIFKSGAMSASAAEEEKPSTTAKRSKGVDQKTISNVSVDEWDCPHPGNRKYMPRRVKANIRKNFEKINAAEKEKADSAAAMHPKK